ncbi:MAG: hypothetical protein RSD88_07970 [Anaerovoracaceae bacterium]
MDNKIIMDLAKQLGLPEKQAQEKAKAYMGKSDEEILQEIMKIKGKLKGNEAAFQKQLQAAKMLAGTMSGQQKAKLEKIIALLEA